MNVIQLIRQNGWLSTIAFFVKYAGERVKGLNPMKLGRQRVAVRERRLKPDCEWLKPTSKW